MNIPSVRHPLAPMAASAVVPVTLLTLLGVESRSLYNLYLNILFFQNRWYKIYWKNTRLYHSITPWGIAKHTTTFAVLAHWTTYTNCSFDKHQLHVLVMLPTLGLRSMAFATPIIWYSSYHIIGAANTMERSPKLGSITRTWSWCLSKERFVPFRLAPSIFTSCSALNTPPFLFYTSFPHLSFLVTDSLWFSSYSCPTPGQLGSDHSAASSVVETAVKLLCHTISFYANSKLHASSYTDS